MASSPQTRSRTTMRCKSTRTSRKVSEQEISTFSYLCLNHHLRPTRIFREAGVICQEEAHSQTLSNIRIKCHVVVVFLFLLLKTILVVTLETGIKRAELIYFSMLCFIYNSQIVISFYIKISRNIEN